MKLEALSLWLLKMKGSRTTHRGRSRSVSAWLSEEMVLETSVLGGDVSG